MISVKTLVSKLHLITLAAMLSVSLLNVQTAYGYITPGGDSNRVTPVFSRYPSPVPRPGSGPIRPTPTPRPGNPYPMPQPNYPHPHPYPVPQPTYPRPRPYPAPYPVPYPVPYPGPYYPPTYPVPGYPRPGYLEHKTVTINRMVYGETFYVNQLLNTNYNYRGYRLKNVHVDVAGNSEASINLIINGRVIDSQYTNGQDVYLYPSSYDDDLNIEVGSLAVQVSGAAYIYSLVFELERTY